MRNFTKISAAVHDSNKQLSDEAGNNTVVATAWTVKMKTSAEQIVEPTTKSNHNPVA